jgi:Rrf2 family nitric oxide-sensitive transcriptional repressor
MFAGDGRFEEKPVHLTFYTDYALRTLIYLALNEGRLSTVEEIAEAFQISRSHLTKVAPRLSEHGFIESVRGRTGGLRLARPASEIRIGDVVRATEEGFRIVECFSPDTNTCRIMGVCNLKGILGEALDAWLEVLDRHTLEDLLSQRQALARRIGLGLESVV